MSIWLVAAMSALCVPARAGSVSEFERAESALEPAELPQEPVRTGEAYRTDTLRVAISFRIGKYYYDPGFDGNGERVAAFLESFRSLDSSLECTLGGITVSGYASPDGKYAFNQRLSVKRVETVKKLLQKHLDIPDSLFTLNCGGIDWGGLMQVLREREDIPHREEILDIIENTPEVTYNPDGSIWERRRFALGQLNGGRDWSYLFTNIYPALRAGAADVTLVVRRRVPEPSVCHIDPVTPAAALPTVERQTALMQRTLVTAPAVRPVRNTIPWLAVKTDMLHDLAAIPSLGMEACLGDRFSLSAEWAYSWWKSDRIHWYWQTYGGDAALRMWLGERTVANRLTGHHIGLYGQMNTFDFELGGRGYLSADWNYAVGVEYGLSIPAGRRFNVDFSVGAGYLHGRFKEYLPIDGHYVWQVTKLMPPFCITKAEVSLVWLIGRDRTGKGGAR